MSHPPATSITWPVINSYQAKTGLVRVASIHRVIADHLEHARSIRVTPHPTSHIHPKLANEGVLKPRFRKLVT